MRTRLAAVALVVAACVMAAPAATAQTPDPREHNFTFAVDGVTIGGVVGYRIGFTRNPVTRTDSRQLNLTYSPDQRVLSITVTEKGLNQLQDWLNSATDTQAPPVHTITIIAKDNSNALLARWDLTCGGAPDVHLDRSRNGQLRRFDDRVPVRQAAARRSQGKITVSSWHLSARRKSRGGARVRDPAAGEGVL